MGKNILLDLIRKNMEGLSPGKIVIIMIGTAISSFGVYNIHQLGVVTEGGVLGMILLANHWLGISPSIVTPVLDIACYSLAFKYLGGAFIRLSAVATLSLASFFRLWEQFPRVLPDMTGTPLLAALCGGVFVGLGVGLIVTRAIVSASASSPPLEPPWRMMSPTPVPTNSPPRSAARSGYADKSGSMGGNSSQTL